MNHAARVQVSTLHRLVSKPGAGRWRDILQEGRGRGFLPSRNEGDLKDKWRNECKEK